jgi:hypothetical protein
VSPKPSTSSRSAATSAATDSVPKLISPRSYLRPPHVLRVLPDQLCDNPAGHGHRATDAHGRCHRAHLHVPARPVTTPVASGRRGRVTESAYIRGQCAASGGAGWPRWRRPTLYLRPGLAGARLPGPSPRRVADLLKAIWRPCHAWRRSTDASLRSRVVRCPLQVLAQRSRVLQFVGPIANLSYDCLGLDPSDKRIRDMKTLLGHPYGAHGIW